MHALSLLPSPPWAALLAAGLVADLGHAHTTPMLLFDAAVCARRVAPLSARHQMQLLGRAAAGLAWHWDQRSVPVCLPGAC